MYYYVKDKKFISEMKGLCGEIMQDLCHLLKEEYDIGAIFYLVGSGAKNLIMQNENNPIDLDYNLEIVRCELTNCRDIKETVRKAFNRILKEKDFPDCEDSKSALTTKRVHFTKGNDTEFSMDVAIVYSDDNDNLHRLIHEKTGWVCYDRYYWVQAPHSRNIREKSNEIKKAGMWENVRTQYSEIKNRYLHYNDHNHSSSICYFEAVNNVYNMLCYKNKSGFYMKRKY